MNEIKNNLNFISFSYFKNIKEVIENLNAHPKFKEIIAIVNNFLNYEIHIINLPMDTDLNKIIETFERINKTGKQLSVFDLLVAKLYKHNINLREILDTSKNQYSFIEYIPPEFILKVIALIRGIEPKRKNILELEPEKFEEHWEQACEALERAYNRMLDIKNGYGILDFKRWAPYSTLIVPLAGLLYYLKSNKLENKSNYEKINKWYWISVFSNRYDQAVDTITFSDFKAVTEWIEK